MKTINNYAIVLHPDDNRTFVAHIPAIRGCHAWGETPEQAREELKNVFAMICEEFLEAKQLKPRPLYWNL